MDFIKYQQMIKEIMATKRQYAKDLSEEPEPKSSKHLHSDTTDGNRTSIMSTESATTEVTYHSKFWGPYLSDRQWGTVREDCSADGDCDLSYNVLSEIFIYRIKVNKGDKQIKYATTTMIRLRITLRLTTLRLSDILLFCKYLALLAINEILILKTVLLHISHLPFSVIESIF
ncbi:hypothetical protein KUTeg_010308 [Tegillarca granosa]|uniref:Uncharacterized protein n=1 Tax=Tegillarca granosa TaxID=220873 RepID=A0ABQ9F6C0_TEGGR|nr:hypothetical protein KUTeg_010308 [Tegillarca granosa]